MSRFASAPWPLKAAYVGLLATLGGALLIGLTVVIALAGLHRLSADLDPTVLLRWLWYYRGDPELRRWLGIGLLASLILALVTTIGVLKARKRPLHGAARWASEAEIRRQGLRARQGVVLGRAGGRLLVFGGSEHVMLHAPTRSGKGVGVVIPNLLTWPDSTVVLDVKRENWEATAGFRSTHGQDVLLFDPLDPEGRTARFNPLGHVDRRDPVAVLDELQKLAMMLFPTPPHTDPFWAEAARTGLIGVGGLVAQTADRPFSLGAIYRALTDGDPRSRLPKLAVSLAKAGRPLSDAASAALADFCSTSENTFASIKQTITARMNLWINPRVCAATDASDFDLRDLRTRRISLYLGVSPDNLVRVAPLYNLLLQQLVDLNTRERPAPERHPVQVLVVLDEFARLGHAAVVARAFAYVAGYGLRLMPVLQSPAQLRAEYGADLAEEIFANCGVEIAFAPKDLKGAQELSERLGYWTYLGRSRSLPAGLSSGKRSVTESDQRRALMLPQELMQLPSDRLIVLRSGAPPIRGRKIVYWRERDFARRVTPPPAVTPFKPRPALPISDAEAPTVPSAPDALALELATFTLGGDPLEPPPPDGASEADIEAWVDRFLDASTASPDPEVEHGR